MTAIGPVPTRFPQQSRRTREELRLLLRRSLPRRAAGEDYRAMQEALGSGALRPAQRRLADAGRLDSIRKVATSDASRAHPRGERHRQKSPAESIQRSPRRDGSFIAIN